MCRGHLTPGMASEQMNTGIWAWSPCAAGFSCWDAMLLLASYSSPNFLLVELPKIFPGKHDNFPRKLLLKQSLASRKIYTIP